MAKLRMNLIGLPQEMLEQILSSLDHRSLLRCSLVSRHLRATIEGSSELTYIIELAQDGMVDNTSLHTLSMSHERLTKLRDRRTAWSGLQWKTSYILPVHGLCNAYELVGGVFAKGIGGHDFLVSWLPTIDTVGHQLHRDDLKITSRDFAIDPGQDLIIFLEEDDNVLAVGDGQSVKLHVRSISTHEHHVKARFPVLRFNIPPDAIYGTFIRNIMLQLADDIVAVLLSTGYKRLLIWNWKEGFLISDSSLEYQVLREDALDFCFLSPRAYLLTSLEGNGSIHLNTFESEAGFRPLHIASFCLPELKEEVIINELSIHTGPYETPSPDEPFATSPTSRIHVLSIQYRSADNFLHPRLCLFVHNHTFLSCVNNHSLGNSTVPWSLWGPHATRLMAGIRPFTWLRYVHGQRFICPQDQDDPFREIQVLDFNIHSFQAAQPRTDLAASEICVTPSTIPPHHLFKEAVTTSLPFSMTSRPISEHYSACMIDAQRIIGLKGEGYVDEELRELHILAF